MEGKLFSPLAWTKSFILIVDAFLATLTPVLTQLLAERNCVQRIRIQSIEKWKVGIRQFFLKWRKAFIGKLYCFTGRRVDVYVSVQSLCL
jgi:Cu(I)/Ag(I) efflux system membrane protein CusA/SilA